MLVRPTVLILLVGALAVVGVAQEPGSAPEARSEKTADQPSEQKDSRKAERPGFGAQLAKETREAAGEDDENAQFKQSASVRWLSKFTGGNLQHAYWLAMLLNFAVIAGVVFWAGKKFCPAPSGHGRRRFSVRWKKRDAPVRTRTGVYQISNLAWRGSATKFLR